MNQPNWDEMCEAKEARVMRAAELIQMQAENVKNAAQATAERMECKLTPIIRPQQPEKQEICEATTMPPLFSDLRDKLDLIDGSLRWINDILDRAEV